MLSVSVVLFSSSPSYFLSVRFLLKDRDIVVDPFLLSLADTFCNPDNIADLLFFELQERVEQGIVELLLE